MNVIQSGIRGFLSRLKYFDYSAQYRKNTLNSFTFSGIHSDNVPDDRYYTVFDHGYYFFDLEELYEWVINRGNVVNPYTGDTFPIMVINQIKRLSKKLWESDYVYNYNAQLTDFFIAIEATGCYANMEGYKKLSIEKLYIFYVSFCEKYSIKGESLDNLYKYYLELDESKKKDAEHYFKFQVLSQFKKIFDENPATHVALSFTIHLADVLEDVNIDRIIDDIINMNFEIL
jgi:hypothetical protein